jgi:hypothetical protein
MSDEQISWNPKAVEQAKADADPAIPRFREHPEEAFAPFQESERLLLRRYVQQAEDLQGCGYWKWGKKVQLKIPGKRGEPSPPNLNYPGEDLLRSLLVVLRPFYLHREKASFKRVHNMLARHARARGGDVAQKALAELRSYREGEKRVFSQSMFRMQVQSSDERGNTETRTITPGQIFEDYLNGTYFHREEERLQRTEAWEALPIPKFIFIQSATEAAFVYIHLAGLVSAILAEPALAAE